METIGEAVKGVSKEVRDLSPSIEWSEIARTIEWREIARTRDNLIHRYHDVNYELIFEIIKENIPTLNRELIKILNQINRKEYLEYQNLIAPKGIDTSTFLIKINNQEKKVCHSNKIDSKLLKPSPIG